MSHSQSPAFGWTARLLAGVLIVLGFISLAPIFAEESHGGARHVAPPASWLTNWNDALRTAKRNNKPVLAMFSAAWCPPCTMMKEKVLTEKSVQQTMNDWVGVYLDEAKEPALLRQYRITAFPTFVILNADGQEEERFVGALAPEDFIKALTDYRKLSGRISALEASAQDAPSWKAVGDKYAELGNGDKAIAAYKKALALDPHGTTGVAADVEFLDALGAINKNREQAKTRLAKLEQQYPKSPRAGQALYSRAVLALDERKDEQARSLLHDYQRRYPTGKFNGRVGDLLKDLDTQAKEPTQAPAGKEAR